MADKKKELDMNKPIVRDLKGAREKAQKDYDDSEKYLKKLEDRKFWFGGGKKHGGLGGMGASDEEFEHEKGVRDRRWKALRELDDAQEFKRGGAVKGPRGVGLAKRGFGKAMKGN